jgi:hypothetical protein
MSPMDENGYPQRFAPAVLLASSGVLAEFVTVIAEDDQESVLEPRVPLEGLDELPHHVVGVAHGIVMARSRWSTGSLVN